MLSSIQSNQLITSTDLSSFASPSFTCIFSKRNNKLVIIFVWYQYRICILLLFYLLYLIIIIYPHICLFFYLFPCIQAKKLVCVYSDAQSYLALCSPMDYSPPGSSAHGIFQARVLDQGAISYSM